MTTYDVVPYPDLSHAQSHPDALATLSTLLGLRPAPVEACRVLEIGCARGGNLIPMALSLPGSTFIGLDYAARQIEAGQATAAALGLPNLSLRQMDIRAVPADLGEFDYVLAHGVYSWVPADVRDELMALCRRHLAPDGIAFISYNTYPGWHMLGSIREMMLYHLREVDQPAERASQARQFLGFLADAVPKVDHSRSYLLNAYSKFLQQEMERIGAKADSFLLHDELEDVNDPVFFYQFVEHAERHGLQFVAEIDFRGLLPNHFPPAVAEKLMKTARSLIEMEQYYDFLSSRTFRQTLLCRQGVTVQRGLTPERLRGLYVGARAVPEAREPDLRPARVEKFKGSDGATLAIDHPISKAALLHLAECWPRLVAFDELLPAAVRRLQSANGHGQPVTATAEDAQVLAFNVLKAFLYSESLVELHAYRPPFVAETGPRPVASPYARWQAATDLKVTNLRHERVELNAFSQYLLRQLDGSHDYDSLLARLLAEPVPEGKLALERDGQPITDPDEIRNIVSARLAEQLRWLAHAALLVA